MNNIQIPNVTGITPVTQSLYNTLGNVNLEMAGLQRITSAINSTSGIQSTAIQADKLSKGLVFDIKDMKGKLLEMTPAEAHAKGFTIKDGDRILVDGSQPLLPAGSGYGGAFEQGMGTSFNINPTQAWKGAGAFPQYTVSPSGQVVPNMNFLDKTAGAGMSFGLPPSINDVEANLKGIDPYGYAQGGGGMSLAQENAELKAIIAQLTGGQGGYAMPAMGNGAGPVTLGSMRANMYAAPQRNYPPTMRNQGTGGNSWLDSSGGNDLDANVIQALMQEFGITPNDLAGIDLSSLQGNASTSAPALPKVNSGSDSLSDADISALIAALAKL